MPKRSDKKQLLVRFRDLNIAYRYEPPVLAVRSSSSVVEKRRCCQTKLRKLLRAIRGSKEECTTTTEIAPMKEEETHVHFVLEATRTTRLTQ